VNNDNEELEYANSALRATNSVLQTRVTELEQDVGTHVVQLQQDNSNLQAQIEELAGLLERYVQSMGSIPSLPRAPTCSDTTLHSP
jgi:cell division septum initiation protein DivIVA